MRESVSLRPSRVTAAHGCTSIVANASSGLFVECYVLCAMRSALHRVTFKAPWFELILQLSCYLKLDTHTVVFW